MFLCPWDSLGKNTGVGRHALLQGIFLIQGLNPYVLGLLRWQAGSLPLVSPGKPKCKIVLFFQNTVYPGYMWRQETESIQFGLKVWFVIMTLIPRRNNAQLGLMKVVNLSRSKRPHGQNLVASFCSLPSLSLWHQLTHPFCWVQISWEQEKALFVSPWVRCVHLGPISRGWCAKGIWANVTT